MYRLEFKENKSKYFPDALAFAKELGGTMQNGFVRIEIYNVLEAYAQIRSLFSIIQNWKGTTATFNKRPVHPYQFLLHSHWIGDCYDERRIDGNCGDGWHCMKIDNLRYHLSELPYKSHKYWYQYGKWEGKKWVIDKPRINKILLDHAEQKAITSCPFFDESKLQLTVNNLPGFLIADGITFEIIYQDKYIDGQLLQVPFSIRHLGIMGSKTLRIQ